MTRENGYTDQENVTLMREVRATLIQNYGEEAFQQSLDEWKQALEKNHQADTDYFDTAETMIDAIDAQPTPADQPAMLQQEMAKVMLIMAGLELEHISLDELT